MTGRLRRVSTGSSRSTGGGSATSWVNPSRERAHLDARQQRRARTRPVRERRGQLELVAQQPLPVVQEDERAHDVGPPSGKGKAPSSSVPVGVPVQVGVVEPVAQRHRSAELALGVEAAAR